MRKIILLSLLSLYVLISCDQNSGKDVSINLHEADSILNTRSIYKLKHKAFISLLDSVKNLISSAEDKTSIKYYFLNKKYAYNLNHSLENFEPNIKMYIDYNDLLEEIDLENDELLDNAYYKSFISSYLDLTSKYRIAQGLTKHRDNMFVNVQFDIAEEQMSGKVKEYAVFKIMEQQIKIFGHEYAKEMLDYFYANCKNKEYISKIDSLYALNQAALSTADEQVYYIENEDSMSAYIFTPKEQEKPSPCIIILHGGGWYIGHPLMRLHVAKDFTVMGFVAISAEHRIKGRQNATPVTGLQDTKAVIRWARKNADKLGIDKDKIIISGFSSGGTLAALAAMTEGYEHKDQDLSISSKPNAVILWSACVDVAVNSWFSYCLNGEDDPKNLSPTHLVKEGLVPMIVFQGDLDEYNDYKTHVEFCKKMKEAGNKCELVLYENTKHVEIYEKDMMQDYKDFLNKTILKN